MNCRTEIAEAKTLTPSEKTTIALAFETRIDQLQERLKTLGCDFDDSDYDKSQIRHLTEIAAKLGIELHFEVRP